MSDTDHPTAATTARPTLLVLAAGRGTRYGGLKQIDPVGPAGETIMEYSVFDAVRAGFAKVVFITGRDIYQALRAGAGDRVSRSVEVVYAYQDDVPAPATAAGTRRAKPWGTAHAVLAARSAVDGPFAVINSDDFYGAKSFQLLADHLLGAGGSSALVGFRLRNTLSDTGGVNRAVCDTTPDGRLTGVSEVVDLRSVDGAVRGTDDAGNELRFGGDELVSMNMWGFRDSVFDDLERQWREFGTRHGASETAEFYLPHFVSAMISRDRETFSVLESPEHWLGVTYPEDRAFVTTRLAELAGSGAYPGSLWGA